MFETILTLSAADDELLAEAQTPSASGVQALTLTAGTIDVPQRIGITSAGDDTGRTFTVTGYDRYGNLVVEEVTGAEIGVATTKTNFASVSSVTVDDDTASTVKVGTVGKAEGPWLPLDRRQAPFSAGIGCSLAGDDPALTYALEGTYDRVQTEGFRETDAAKVDLFTGKTAAFEHHQQTPIVAVRLAITAHTSGGVKAAVIQGR